MRIAAITSILFLAGSSALAEPAALQPLDRAQPTSWSLTCQPEAQDTTVSAGRTAVLKITAGMEATAAIVHWKAPAGNWITLALRPVSDRTWASRVELGSDEGTHQLQCMILGASTGDGDSHILARTYQLVLPSFKLDETGGDEVWSYGQSRRADLMRTPILPPAGLQSPPAPVKAQSGFSPILAAMIVFAVNLVFAFAVGLALTWHRRRKAHRETPFMHEIHGRLAEAGMIAVENYAPVPIEAEAEPEKHDVVEDIAASAVMESMDQAIEESKEEGGEQKPVTVPEEGVDIRTAPVEEVETKLDMNDLSF